MPLTQHPHHQPQIDSSLMLLHRDYLKCNHQLDLYGSYCALSKEFSVEQVALTGTTIDVSDFCQATDYQAFDAFVNERLDAADFAAEIRTDVYAMQHDEVAA